jgi:TorA maturation chaperone TorD
VENQQPSIRAQIYLLLSTLYRQTPNGEMVDFLKSVEVETQPSEMQQAWKAIIVAAKNTNFEQLEDEYQDLFIGIGRGEVMPFASWHITGSLMEKPLALIRQDMALLGFEREDQVKEPEDHIAALCEVMAMLTEECEEIQQAFFNRHIAPWFTSLTEQITQAKHANFYGSVAQLTHAFLTLEAVHFSANRQSSKFAPKIDVKNVTEYDSTQP